MSEVEQEPRSRKRILIALDTSSRGLAALKVAVQLALEASADIEGLFVEDEDLVRLAALPFACEFDFSSSSSRPLAQVRMERDLQSAAQNAQIAFSAALEHENVPWTFRTVRGTVAAVSMAASNQADLLVIGQRGRSPRMMASEFLPRRNRIDGGVLLVFDGRVAGESALELAAKLAEKSKLSVLVLTKNERQDLEKCLAWLRDRKVRAEVNQAVSPDLNTIIKYVTKWNPEILIINRDSEFIGDRQLTRLVDDFDCPVILC